MNVQKPGPDIIDSASPLVLFDYRKAMVAEVLATALRDAYYGGYGCSWDYLCDLFSERPNPDATVHGAWPHVKRSFQQQGFEVYLTPTIPHEWKLRYVGEASVVAQPKCSCICHRPGMKVAHAVACCNEKPGPPQPPLDRSRRHG